MKKIVALLLMFCMSVALFSSCGEDTSESASENALQSESEKAVTSEVLPAGETSKITDQTESKADTFLANLGDGVLASGKLESGNIAWALDENSILTIAGDGAIMPTGGYNVQKSDQPWGDYADLIKEIKVEDGITFIGEHSFCYCEKLTSVEIAGSVQTIDKSAFYICSNLENVILADGIKEINDYAFLDCEALKNISFPDSLEYIGKCAFEMGGLTSITIPGSVTTIGDGAFCGCEDLAEVNLNEGLESIGEYAFAETSLQKITIPSTVTYIGNNLLASDNVQTSNYYQGEYFSETNYEVTFKGNWPGNIGALYNMMGTIYYPANNDTFNEMLEKVEANRGKYSSKLASDLICIPYEYEPSGSCGDGTTWTVLNNGTLQISGSGSIDDFTESGSAPWIGYCNEITSIEIDSGITAIGMCAFRECINVTSIRFTGDAPTFGAGCFQDVTATAYYPSGNPTWTDDVMQDRGGSITWEAY